VLHLVVIGLLTHDMTLLGYSPCCWSGYDFYSINNIRFYLNSI